MNTTKRGRVSGDELETMTMLPEELILEILTWVPGRELGRCKCVCRLWKSLIGNPQFLPLYRRRNRCLITHWSKGGRLHFYYSPLRRHRTDPEEHFRRLGSLPVGRRIDPVTQLVNGVICSGRVVSSGSSGREPDLQLKVISVCTGQALLIPPPIPHDGDTKSLYNLGYDPKSKRYKLLRLIFPYRYGMEADVITLGPTGTAWEWRKLDRDGAGILRLPWRDGNLYNGNLYNVLSLHGVLMFSGDGVLCWICEKEGMILFDMNKEIFRWVNFPAVVVGVERAIVPRVLIEEERLDIYLWVLPSRDDEDCECFLLENEVGNVWRKRTLQLRRVVRDHLRWLEVANGSPFCSSEPSIMLMNSYPMLADSRRDVYYTSMKGMRRFWFGKLPCSMASGGQISLTKWDASTGFSGRLSCLLDSNVLHLSLKDVLNGNGLV